MARTSVAVQLEKLRKERELLNHREKALMSQVHERALAKIVLLARQFNLTLADISEALQAGASLDEAAISRASVKIPPKYRNPADPAQTWTGRGRPPHWAKALLEAGRLELALIETGRELPAGGRLHAKRASGGERGGRPVRRRLSRATE